MSKKSVEDYEPIPGQNQVAQIAHFLDWAAHHLPYTYFPPNEIAKAIRKYKRTPRLQSPETESIRKCMVRVRKTLHATYGRGYDCQKIIGYRATVDADDTVRFEITSRAKRLAGAKNNLDRSLTLVKASALSNTPEGRKLKTYLQEVQQTVRLISDERIQRLLPPKPEEDSN